MILQQVCELIVHIYRWVHALLYVKSDVTAASNVEIYNCTAC
jgi:hypothetical protein